MNVDDEVNNCIVMRLLSAKLVNIIDSMDCEIMQSYPV